MSAFIKVNSNHIDFLRENRIFLNANGDFEKGWLKIGQQVNLSKAIIEPYTGYYKGLNFSSIGAFSYTKSVFHPSIKIGRYCSIAALVTLMPADHPTTRLSTCGFDYATTAMLTSFEKDTESEFEKTPFNQKGQYPKIGHDVWISHDVMIKRGVTIGTGAIIGTKSVVTKDVPPYAIVAGVPATIRKYRFEPEIIERLLASEWWEYGYTQFNHLNTLNPEDFLDGFERMKLQGDLIKLNLPLIDIREEFLKLA